MLRFKVSSPALFDRNLLVLTLGCAAAVVPCWLVAWLLAGFAGAAVAGGIAGALTMFAAYHAVQPQVKLLPGATSAVLAGTALGLLFPAHPILGCLAFGGFFGLAQASVYNTWDQKLSLIASGALAALLGGVVCGLLPQLAIAVAVPQPLVLLGMFGVFGFYMGVGTVPGHLEIRRDLVGAKYAQIAPGLRPDVRDFVSRVYALHGRFQKVIGPGTDLPPDQVETFENDLDAMVTRIFGLACRWQEIEVHLTGSKADDLDQRIREMEQKVASCPDPQVQAQYEKTRTALVARSRDLKDIQNARERIVSSLTYSYTKLEGLYYTLIKARCSETQNVTGEIDGLLRHVGQLADEMDAATKSLDELTMDAPDLLPPGGGAARAS